MDSLTKKIHFFIGYGHIHTHNLNDEQKRSLVSALARDPDEFPALYDKLCKAEGFQLGQLLAQWENHDITHNAYNNAVKDLFFNYYVDLIDELFEAELHKNDDDYMGSGIENVFANRRFEQEVSSHASR